MSMLTKTASIIFMGHLEEDLFKCSLEPRKSTT